MRTSDWSKVQIFQKFNPWPVLIETFLFGFLKKFPMLTISDWIKSLDSDWLKKGKIRIFKTGKDTNESYK